LELGRRIFSTERRTRNMSQFVLKEHFLMRLSKRVVVALMCSTLLIGACAVSFGVELSLAGVKLGSSATFVLKKYGNPTRITIGTVPVATVSVQPTNSATGVGTGTTPGGPSAMPNSMGPLGATGGSYNPYGGDSGGLPGLPGLPGIPGMYGPPGTMPGAPVQQQVTEEQVTWTYDLTDGTTVEFLIAGSGRVVQVTVGGEKATALSKTSKGMKIGNTYKDVIFKYGYPEGQSVAGRFLRVSYADKQRCVFTFLDKKLVGVTIALKAE
jgi:hypothetical protein